MSLKHLLATLLGVVGSLTFAQPLPTSESRFEMAMEWVKSARPVLKPGADAVNALAPSSGALMTAVPSISEPSRSAPVVVGVWSIELSDKRLSPALQRWAGQAGWHLVWEADRDFLIDAALHVEGEFLFAIDTAMRSLAESDYPLQAIANRKTRVLRIVRFLDMGTH